MEISKETAISFVIKRYGKANHASIKKSIDVLNHECELMDPKDSHDLLCIEVNVNLIGFLYSALRTMCYNSTETPLILN